MFSAPAKRIKLLKEKNESSLVDAESGFHSEIDFSSSTINTASKSIESDFVLSPEKRKILATRRASLNQISSSLGSDAQHSASAFSSGYNSLLSSSSNLTSSVSTTSFSSSSRQSRTPKKRKSEISESDENFYNSFQFISPLKKIRRKDDKNCAKLILKEKSSSENVILSSTPIRKNTQKWQKFRSFHPEKITEFGKRIGDEENDEIDTAAAVSSTEKLAKFANTTSQKTSIDNSLSLSSFNLSNESFNLTHSLQLQQDIPTNIKNLWTDDIKQQQYSSLNAQSTSSFGVFESQVSQNLSLTQSNTSSTSSEKRIYLNGREKLDILGRLHANHNIALGKILGYLDEESLLSLSHVSQNYRTMIQKNKLYETKRQNYLKATTQVKENKLPTVLGLEEHSVKTNTLSEKKRRKAFTDYNINENQMKLRKKRAPSSPSTRFKEMQKKFQSQQNTTFKKCPRCNRPATIKKVKIRNSPRKKKINLFGISPSSSTGRVKKRPRGLLSKTTFENRFFESTECSPFYITMPNVDDEVSRSPNRSTSSYESQNSSSDDADGGFQEIYEYAVCGAAGCSYKFCVKCNCKYHPRQQCADLSPPSPNRYPRVSGGGACTRASLKSLRRLAY